MSKTRGRPAGGGRRREEEDALALRVYRRRKKEVRDYSPDEVDELLQSYEGDPRSVDEILSLPGEGQMAD